MSETVSLQVTRRREVMMDSSSRTYISNTLRTSKQKINLVTVDSSEMGFEDKKMQRQSHNGSKRFVNFTTFFFSSVPLFQIFGVILKFKNLGS